MRPCATCKHPLREEIDKRLISGEGYSSICTWLESQGYKLSKTAVKRHAENHIEGFIPRGFATHKKTKVEDYDIDPDLINTETPVDPRYIDPVALRKELNCPESINNSEDLAYTAKRFLAEILTNQLAIVLVKQRAFMQARCSYPNSEIRGLNNLIGIIGDVTGRSKHDKLGSNHFDLDKALDFSQESEEFKGQLLTLITKNLEEIGSKKSA
jgi:hypothetical protein